MRLLAIDLAWDGPSGYVYWKTDSLDPVGHYGEIVTKVPNKLKGAERIMEMVGQIYDKTLNLMGQNLDIVTYEVTDWHQSLGGKKNWKQVYAQERVVQAALARAEAALVLACRQAGIHPISIGARECKQEFVGSGVLSKENVAWTFMNTYNQEFRTRFELVQNMEADAQAEAGGCYLHDNFTNQYVSHHISDAFVIAYVVSRREHQRKLVKDAG